MATPAQNQPAKATNEELSKLSVPAPAAKLTIDERVEVFKKLQALNEKREKLKESLEKIKGFTISRKGGELMKISDNNGNTLTFAHPLVVGELVATAKAKFETLLKEVEAEFIF